MTRFKTFRKWEPREEELLKLHFYSVIPFLFSSHHGNRYEKLNEILKREGYTDRTPKALSRKCYRLGLTSVKITNEETINTTCTRCNVNLLRPKRYAHRALCHDCTEKSRHTPTDEERNKLYHRQYIKQWRNKQT